MNCLAHNQLRGFANSYLFAEWRFIRLKDVECPVCQEGLLSYHGEKDQGSRELGMSSISPMMKLEALQRPPFVLSWNEPGNPLPMRVIRGPAKTLVMGMEAPPWIDSGSLEKPFDFCGKIKQLCGGIVRNCHELSHIDVSRILVAVTQARTTRTHGLQARVTPLRFRNGGLIRRRRGTLFQIQRYYVNSREVLYLVTFCLPRFLDLSFDEKFVTLFHELYHINPAFDGDLRRHEGRYSVHSHSQRLYDQHMAALARGYLTNGADTKLHDFLRLDFAQLQQRHQRVLGVMVPRPKLYPLPSLPNDPVPMPESLSTALP